MCELLIKIECPYSVTLFIDAKQYSPDEFGEYKIQLDADIEYDLKVFVKKPKMQSKNLFKIKGRFTDEFDDVIYKAKFTIPSKHKTSKIVFAYKKCETTNFEKRKVLIPRIEILRKNKINIYNIQNNIFTNKKSFCTYVLRHRWIETLVYFFIIFTGIFYAVTHYIDYINNVKFEYVAKTFANTHIQAIILTIIELLIVIAFMIFSNVMFIKKVKGMLRKAGDGSPS